VKDFVDLLDRLPRSLTSRAVARNLFGFS